MGVCNKHVKYKYFFMIISGLGVMVFNATYKSISVISWQSVLLGEETRVPGENHWPAANHWQTLSHNVVSSTPRLSGVRTHNVSDDRHWLHIGSCKSNYHTITTMTAHFFYGSEAPKTMYHSHFKLTDYWMETKIPNKTKCSYLVKDHLWK